MTLDEAIEHCDEIIEKEDCSKCAKEHEKLKKWLEELKELKNPQPYKFEDLKADMWIWDDKWEECFEICEVFPKDEEIHVLIHQNRINAKRYEPIKFEENRFYPVIIGGEE